MKRRKAGKQLKTGVTKVRAGTAKTVVFDQAKEVRAIARERLGRVKAGQTMVPKAERKPKHKKPPGEEGGE
jgi:hypothetical protein